MKFLIIHNQYSRLGGEESVVEAQRRLLFDHGHSVVMYVRRHGEVGKFSSFFTSLCNRSAAKDIEQIVALEKPDVAIVHNLFPIISAAVLPVLRRANVRIMMTLHNYRLVCPNGLFYTHGKVCERCGTSALGVLNCAFRQCEGSFGGSVAWAVRAMFSRRYFREVDRFLPISQFQLDKITQYSNLTKAKFVVNPNFVENLPESTAKRDDFVGFVGRLSEEKGVDLLLEAARLLPDRKFRVAGEKAADFTSTALPPNVELIGFLDKQGLADFYSSAQCIVLTSSCYEGGVPLTVIEAIYYGATVIVPRWAALPELCSERQPALFYIPADAADLAAKIQENHATNLDDRQKVLEKYNSEQYYQNIMRCI